MKSGGIRVAVTLPGHTTEAWHWRCLDRIRAVDGVVLLDSSSDLATPDVVVDLANVGVPGEKPRYGVWQFRFGDGAPVAHGAPGTLVRLYRLTADRDRAVVLHEGWFRAQTADAPGTRSVVEC